MADGNPTPKLSEKWIARFWARVDKSGGPDACWPWTGCLRRGYGAVWLDGRLQPTHGIAFLLASGSPATPMCLHSERCETRACCNPDHLRPGTQADNMADRKKLGRYASGDEHWSRRRPELILRGAESWSNTHLDRIARGERHGSKLHPERVHRGESLPQSKITEADVRTIRAMHGGGMTAAAVARDTKISIHIVYQVVARKTWKHIP